MRIYLKVRSLSLSILLSAISNLNIVLIFFKLDKIAENDYFSSRFVVYVSSN